VDDVVRRPVPATAPARESATGFTPDRLRRHRATAVPSGPRERASHRCSSDERPRKRADPESRRRRPRTAQPRGTDVGGRPCGEISNRDPRRASRRSPACTPARRRPVPARGHPEAGVAPTPRGLGEAAVVELLHRDTPASAHVGVGAMTIRGPRRCPSR
jgi:hypothetical protein